MTGNTWDESFTTPHNPAADAVIAGHMRQIRDAILALESRNVGSVVLTGGFGRGEGGVIPDEQGSFRPVNDYDMLVVTRQNGLPARLWLRRRLKALEPVLSRACGIRVDFACKTPRMLRELPHTVDACETALGYRLLWGDAAPLEAIRWREPERLPAVEAVRYLFNRGAALLWARRMLETAPEVDQDRWQFVWIAVQKARLSWGDALLLQRSCYTTRYSERAERLAGISLPPELAFVADAYREALHFKLQPDFKAGQGVSLSDRLAETVAGHEAVWRWIETAPGAPARSPERFWPEHYADDQRCVLRDADSPPAVRARLYWLALNLWRVRPGSRRLLFEHPEERLVRVLPLLLFGPHDSETPWQELARLLGAPHNRPEHRLDAVLADRFIEIWHPGPPY